MYVRYVYDAGHLHKRIVAHVSCVFCNNVGIFDADARVPLCMFSPQPSSVRCSIHTLHKTYPHQNRFKSISSEVAMYLYVTIRTQMNMQMIRRNGTFEFLSIRTENYTHLSRQKYHHHYVRSVIIINGTPHTWLARMGAYSRKTHSKHTHKTF